MPGQIVCTTVRGQSLSLNSGPCFLKILLYILPAQYSLLPPVMTKESNKLIFTEEEINDKAPNMNCAIIITMVGNGWFKDKELFCGTGPSSTLKTPRGLPTPTGTRGPRGLNLPWHAFHHQTRPGAHLPLLGVCNEF